MLPSGGLCFPSDGGAVSSIREEGGGSSPHSRMEVVNGSLHRIDDFKRAVERSVLVALGGGRGQARQQGSRSLP